MEVCLVPDPSPSTIAAAAAEFQLGPGQLLTVLIAEEGSPDLDEVVQELSRLDVEFCGALFPFLIYGTERVSRGALLVALDSNVQPTLVRGLEGRDFARSELADIEEQSRGAHTAFLFVDGLTTNVALLLSEVFGRLGNSINYIGGGAGSLSLKQQPCVFTRDGAFQDAAIIAFARQNSRLGVRHGWNHLEGPLVATRAHGNVIQELNWKSAFEVYRDLVSPYTSMDLTPQNIFQVTNAFPFGIYKDGAEDVVRDPVSVGDNGELICVGEVPENAVLNILRGDNESLISAAGKSAEDCCAGPPVTVRSTLVVDCVSRTLFLGSDFERELDTVRTHLSVIAEGLPLWGILSLGEISSYGEGFVEFFNKTIVTAVLHD